MESTADTRDRAKKVIKKLKLTYTDAKCSLNFSTPFQLLVATILSAQCTDEKVNQVTAEMFNKYGDKYFLAEVWSSPDSMNGAALLQSKAERETARGNPRVARIAVPLRTGTITLASLR